MVQVPDELVKPDRSAEEKRAKRAGLTGEAYDAQRRHWRKASEKVQAAVTAHAEATVSNRYELKQAVDEAARHAQDDPPPAG
ncbi:hypothetical protein [Streptomyces sp. NPDC102462]|uniref:hypothetical protein n=1 Tax=Streptomyces sp. NPDC102462 TaxID=3366178 RepID=UPI0037F32BB3